MIKKFADGVTNDNLSRLWLCRQRTVSGIMARHSNLGTKWDVCDGNIDVDDDGLSATGFFNTAWEPGIDTYQKLTELGFKLDVIYFEPWYVFHRSL
jgi:hypothetical protein